MGGGEKEEKEEEEASPVRFGALGEGKEKLRAATGRVARDSPN